MDLPAQLPPLRPFPGYPQIVGTPDVPLEYGRVHVLQLFYGDWVALPKKPGELAIEVRLRSDHALTMELNASLSRTDIGLVKIFQVMGLYGRHGSRLSA